MKYIIFSLLALPFWFSHTENTKYSFIVNSVNDDNDETDKILNEYFAKLNAYSFCLNKSLVDLRHQELNDMHESIELPCYIDDLNNEEDETLELQTYYNRIEDNYKNEVEIKFDNLKIANCKIAYEGKYLSVVAAEKNVIFHGKKTTTNVFISVNISDRKIVQIVPAKFAKDACSKSVELAVFFRKSEEQSKFAAEQRYKQGDKAFKEKDYFLAKECYEQAFKILGREEITQKVKNCDNEISCITIFESADDLFAKQNYVDAYERYMTTPLSCENYDKVAYKLSTCKDAIAKRECDKKLGAAEEYAAEQNYEKAISLAEEALNCAKEPALIRVKIKAWKEAKKDFAIAQVQKAVYMIEHNDRKAGFKLMYKYETSPVLNAANYTHMAFELDTNAGNIGSYMKFTASQRYYYARMFCIKALQLDPNYPKARLMWDNIFSLKNK
jgi:tetratricopeptide (TPR) repeat protein